MSRIETVRDWLLALGTLVAGSMPKADAHAKLNAYAPLLAAEFGAECFTPVSLTAVARQCKFFPSFGEVSAALAAWWQEHRAPDLAQLAGPEPADHYERYNIPKPREAPTEAEKAAVAEMVAAWRHETAARHVSAVLAQAKPVRKPAELTDAQLLAAFEAMGQRGAVRAAALRAKLATAESVSA